MTRDGYTEARQQVITQVLEATTLSEIAAATQALDVWLTVHPDDIGMEDGYEQLALMRQAVLAVGRQAAVPVITL